MSTVLYGESFSMQNLTPEQVALLEKTASNMKTNNTKETAQKVSEWMAIGENLGKGLAGCAKELGVQVNDFVQTPVGKIASFIIIYKLIGRDVIHYGFGIVFFMIAISMWIYFFRRMCVIKTITYGDKVNKLGFRQKTIEYTREGNCDGTRFCMLLVLLLSVGVSLLIMFN
jgi:hypothetical protein